jgi:ATP-binding cassette, subfamily C (CFTR/MRP), member 1
MADSVLFSRIMDEYGSQEKEKEEAEKKAAEEGKLKPKTDAEPGVSAEEKKKGQAALMSAEERNTGAVTGETYRKYLGFAGSVMWAPYIAIMLALVQGAAGAFVDLFGADQTLRVF